MDSQIYWVQDEVIVPDGVSLNYRYWFTNDKQLTRHPPFLLLHDLAVNLRIWDKLAVELVETAGSIIFTLDQRGHGLSDKPSFGYSTAQIVEDVSVVTDFHYLYSEHPILIGHGWGASIALAYAATNPNEISGLICLDGESNNQVAWRENEDVLVDMVQLQEDNTITSRVIQANYTQILEALRQTDHLTLASKVQCPVLIISAELASSAEIWSKDIWLVDWLQVKRKGFQQLKTALNSHPQVEFVTINDTINNILIQNPKKLVKLIAEFI